MGSSSLDEVREHGWDHPTRPAAADTELAGLGMRTATVAQEVSEHIASVLVGLDALQTLGHDRTPEREARFDEMRERVVRILELVRGLSGAPRTNERDAGVRAPELEHAARAPRAHDDAASAPATSEGSRAIHDHVRGRILVVDDERLVRTALQRLLGARHDVETVATGEDAQHILQDDADFDLVLCDVSMPRLSGVELHAWAAEHHPTLATRFVFITGGIFAADHARYLAKVPNRRIVKPFAGEELRRVADRWVRTVRHGGAPL